MQLQPNEIRISYSEQVNLVKEIRALLDARFDSINTTKEHGKRYRAEEESEVLALVYQELLKKMDITSKHQYIMILRGHLEKIETSK